MSSTSTQGVSLSEDIFGAFCILSFFLAIVIFLTLNSRLGATLGVPFLFCYLAAHIVEFNSASRNSFTNSLFDFLLLKSIVPIYFQTCLLFVCYQFKRDLNRMTLIFQDKESILQENIRVDTHFILICITLLISFVIALVIFLANPPELNEEEEIRASSLLLTYTTFSTFYALDQLLRIRNTILSGSLQSKIYLEFAVFVSHGASLVFLRSGLQNATFFVLGLASIFTNFYLLLVSLDAIYPSSDIGDLESKKRLNYVLSQFYLD